MTVNDYVLEHIARQFLADARAAAARRALLRDRSRPDRPLRSQLTAALTRLVSFLRPTTAAGRAVPCPEVRR